MRRGHQGNRGQKRGLEVKDTAQMKGLLLVFAMFAPFSPAFALITRLGVGTYQETSSHGSSLRCPCTGICYNSHFALGERQATQARL